MAWRSPALSGAFRRVGSGPVTGAVASSLSGARAGVASFGPAGLWTARSPAPDVTSREPCALFSLAARALVLPSFLAAALFRSHFGSRYDHALGSSVPLRERGVHARIS